MGVGHRIDHAVHELTHAHHEMTHAIHEMAYVLCVTSSLTEFCKSINYLLVCRSRPRINNADHGMKEDCRAICQKLKL